MSQLRWISSSMKSTTFFWQQRTNFSEQNYVQVRSRLCKIFENQWAETICKDLCLFSMLSSKKCWSTFNFITVFSLKFRYAEYFFQNFSLKNLFQLIWQMLENCWVWRRVFGHELLRSITWLDSLATYCWSCQIRVMCMCWVNNNVLELWKPIYDCIIYFFAITWKYIKNISIFIVFNFWRLYFGWRS